MQHSNPSSALSTPSYLELEGVAQKEQLIFDYKKFAIGFQKRRLDMLFPKPGVHLNYIADGFLCNTISAWDSEFPSCCEGYWNDYINAVVTHCGTWDNRVRIPEELTIPRHAQMVAGVLQLDRKYLQAAFKRLYGIWITEDTLITYKQLGMCALALFNPMFGEVENCENWAAYVEDLNHQHRMAELREAAKKAQEERRESQIADLLTEFDEVK